MDGWMDGCWLDGWMDVMWLKVCPHSFSSHLSEVWISLLLWGSLSVLLTLPQRTLPSLLPPPSSSLFPPSSLPLSVRTPVLYTTICHHGNRSRAGKERLGVVMVVMAAVEEVVGEWMIMRAVFLVFHWLTVFVLFFFLIKVWDILNNRTVTVGFKDWRHRLHQGERLVWNATTGAPSCFLHAVLWRLYVTILSFHVLLWWQLTSVICGTRWTLGRHHFSLRR